MQISVEDYRNWLRDNHSVDLKRSRSQYEAAARKIINDIQETNVWQELDVELFNIGQDSSIATQNNTLGRYWNLELQTKTFESFLNKTYRSNIIYNENFPNAPVNGWILPNNWFSRINDIVRTMYVVKYLDGVKTASEYIMRVFSGSGHECEVEYKANDDGYYAAHVYAAFDIEIPQLDFDTNLESITVEIQITTRIQEILKDLLHTYYRKSRLNPNSEGSSHWKWEYNSAEFKTNYIGHVLHYIEGMIVDVRDLQE